MIGFPLGLATANAIEWFVHKYVFHELGSRKGSTYAFHWRHHQTVRRHGHVDADYQQPLFSAWNNQTLEAAGLIAATIAFLPLTRRAPFFVLAIVYSAIDFHRKHKRSHLDPEWARVHLPWHYEHHMGVNQNANWCVSHPWFDRLMGTSTPYTAAQGGKPARATATVAPAAQGSD